jgi:hypothetical protein
MHTKPSPGTPTYIVERPFNHAELDEHSELL